MLSLFKIGGKKEFSMSDVSTEWLTGAMLPENSSRTRLVLASRGSKAFGTGEERYQPTGLSLDGWFTRFG